MRACIAAALLSLEASGAEVIARWDFNSALADGNPATGELAPSYGSGTLAPLGGVTHSFGSVAGGATSDPAAGDNSQARLARFPAQGAADKAAGIELRASTAGFRNVRLRWDLYQSATASRHLRVKYTTDGENWLDHSALTNAVAGSWRRERAVSFAGIPAAGDNPRFACRIVAEMAPGTGEVAYRAVSEASQYSPAGVWWLDRVTLEGDPLHPALVPVAIWTFNSPVPDADPSTGESPGVSAAGGTSLAIGTVAGGVTSDAAPDNSMLRAAGFPSRTEGSKTAGVTFRASTTGFKPGALVWDQYNSASASRYWRVQYSTNGIDFTDHAAVTNSVASKWTLSRTVSFAGIPGVENNPEFAFRFVSEFESSAAGAGEDAYRAVDAASAYSAAGTLWLDMITLLGSAAVSNRAPVLRIRLAEGRAILSWETAGGPYQVLESMLATPWTWVPVPIKPAAGIEIVEIILPADGPGRVFQLRQGDGGEPVTSARSAVYTPAPHR